MEGAGQTSDSAQASNLGPRPGNAGARDARGLGAERGGGAKGKRRDVCNENKSFNMKIMKMNYLI